MTWHQWHVEYPIDKKMGLLSERALSKASAPQGYQSTGLCACCSRYGLFSPARRLVCMERRFHRNASQNRTMSDSYRIERDTMGEMRVPAHALYGAQTARAIENF